MQKIRDFVTSNKGVFISLLIIIVIGTIIRIVLVGRTDFWYDEAFTGTVVMQDWKSMFTILIEDKMHPPIYYSLLKLWATVFGPTDVSLRSFSLLFGVALIPLTYLFGIRFEKDKVKARLFGLIAAFFVAFSPFFFSYSVEARSYSMLQVFGALSGILFIKALSKSPYKFNKLWLITILIILSTFLVHYMSVIHICLYGVAYLIYVLIDKGKFYSKRFWIRLGLILIGGYSLLITIFSIPFVAGLVEQLKKRMYWIPDADLFRPINSIYAFLFGVDRQAMNVPPVLEPGIPIHSGNIAVIIFVILVVSTVLLILKHRKDKTELFKIVYLLLFAFGSLFSVALFSDIGIDMYVERYLSIYGLFILMLIAYLAVKVWRYFAILFIAVFLIIVATINFPPSSHQYKEISNYVDNVMYSEHLYSCDTFTMIIFNNYLPDHKDRLILYAPNNYNVFSKSALYNTDKVVNSFDDSKPGDAFICTETRDYSNLIFEKEFNGLYLYKFK